MNKLKTLKALFNLAIFIISTLTLCAAHSQGMQTDNLAKSKYTNTNVLNTDEIDKKLSILIKRYSLTGKPIAEHPIPNIQSPKAQLGMKLFFTKTLGGENTTACASCHHPMLGGGDNLSLSIGVDAEQPDILGSERKKVGVKHIKVPRNAPTTFNVAFWNKVMFHDARIERVGKFDITTPDVPYPKADALAGDTLVQAQARFPITSIDEMRGGYLDNSLNQTLRRALATRLKKNWLDDFRYGFSDPKGTAEDLITEQNYSEALAEYERSQVFINNPWKSYIEGDINAISDSAKQGALLFYTEHEKGGAGCASCHSGDFFTNEKAYNTAMPQIGAGKKNGKTGSNDYGCNLVSNKENDKFRFRTPTLLNVEVTGPWGHDGAYTSLEAITKHMLSPTQAAINYGPLQLTQKNINIKDVYKNTLEAVNAGIDLKAKDKINKDDVKHLVSFLKALTDPCVKDRACLSKWTPKASDNDPDGMMLHAVDSITGKPL
jgi:cytochrome c peroxidase